MGAIFSFISCDPDIITSQIKVQNAKVIVYFYLVGINIQNKTLVIKRSILHKKSQKWIFSHNFHHKSEENAPSDPKFEADPDTTLVHM